ncbi:nickel pincer cofactor biosynthesis protein LarB [Candidatus Margulisiibacteriota bacterium]
MKQFANIDYDRLKRTGVPEVLFSRSKTVDQIRAIALDMKKKNGYFFATQISQRKYKQLMNDFPKAVYNKIARTLRFKSLKKKSKKVIVISGGTSDGSVAEEAKETLLFLGYSPTFLPDVGISGLHRIIDKLPLIKKHDVAIVVAGMEGALPSVLAGLVSLPIIGVPTDVGYGVHFDGLTPLYSMLTSCSAGITVVNINNGFGAACAAHRILGRKK